MYNLFKISCFLLLTIIIITMFDSCATIMAPNGGPKDTIPPVILNFEPKNNTLNYKSGNIILEFSKFMNKSKVIENIFISPSVPLKFNWSKKTLEIVFNKALQDTTTYSFQLDTEYLDFLGNKPEKAFNLIFSTGQSLDSGSISGKLFSEKPDGIYIFAYRIDNINPDTLNPSKVKAHYRTQVGTSGEFQFNGLKMGKYRFFAVDDKFKDELIDFNSDQISSANRDIIISNKKEKFNLRIGNPIDNLAPTLTNAISINQRKIAVMFSEDIDTNSINSRAFRLSDSNGTETNEVISAYLKDKSSKEVILISKDSMFQKDKWKVTATTNFENSIKDLSKNKISDSNNIAYFYGSDEKDTNKLSLINFEIKDSTKEIETDKFFLFNFNQAISFDEFKKRVSLNTIDDKEVNSEMTQIQSNSFKIKPLALLNSRSWYKIKIDMNKFTSLEGNSSKDTTFLVRFSTKSKAEGLIVSGQIIDSTNLKGKYILELTSTDKRSKYITSTFDRNWKFDNVLVGTYKLSIYLDENLNNTYDFGTFYPFKTSEVFYYLEKEIKVNSGWSIEDIILKITK